VVNVVVATSFMSPYLALPVLAGAVAPDVPIVVLYVREHYFRGLPDEQIWRESYQRPFWLNLIHGAHSIPLSIAGVVVAMCVGAAPVAAFFGSVLFHALLDFPLHAEDAHRHFLPLSNYRFISPFSYWDVRYHARVVIVIEALVSACASCVLWARSSGPLTRLGLVGVVLYYLISGWRTVRG
jgi:hypothetical protein